MIDTHCHLQFNAYKGDADEVNARCKKKGVILNVVGSQRDTSQRAVEYAEKYDNIYATVGLHPVHLFATEVDEEEISFKSREEVFDYEFYKKLAAHPKVVAIGECGLELHHLPEGADAGKILEKQREVFLEQYKLAREMDLPLVIHVRDAHKEMIEILKSLKTKINGVVHCYTGNWQEAEEYLGLGLYVGFTGIVTFPAKKTNPKPTLDLLEVVEKCPMDRIFIETDAPYLAPQAYRGQRCEPWMVEEVAKKIAGIKKMDFDEAVMATDENARRLFTKLSP